MKKSKMSPEQRSRYDAYAGEEGVTYHHHRLNDLARTNVWHYLKDVQRMQFQHTEGKVPDASVDPNDARQLQARATALRQAASYRERMVQLKAEWGDPPSSLLSQLLGRVVALKPLPRTSAIYTLRADEETDDLSWGSGAWMVGMIGARRSPGSLLLDIRLDDALMEDKAIRRRAYGFAAGAVAIQHIPYDRGKKHTLRSIIVQPAPNMEHPFQEFDYIRERLQRSQQAELAALRSSSPTRQAIRRFHEEELVALGG